MHENGCSIPTRLSLPENGEKQDLEMTRVLKQLTAPFQRELDNFSLNALWGTA
jgi:hypothetical protein